MTSTISFQQRVQIIEEPTPLTTEETTEKVIGVKVSKIGNQPATAKVSFTGSSTSTKNRYLDRAFKSSKPDGDFTASTQTLEWGEEEGVQEAKFTLKGDRKEEGAEYLYATVSTKDAKIGIYRTHLIIVDSLAGYISSYIADPFTTGGVTTHAMKTGKMNFVLTDVNEIEYPESVLPSQKYDEEVKNIVNYGEVGEDIWFAFEYHVKGVWPIDHKILGEYNSENGTEISQYSTLTLELPFYNNSSQVIPVTLANIEMGNFYGATNEQLNGSLTGIVLPWSNRMIFDYARGVWKSTPDLLLMASVEPSNRPYFHINGTALLPQVDR